MFEIWMIQFVAWFFLTIVIVVGIGIIGDDTETVEDIYSWDNLKDVFNMLNESTLRDIWIWIFGVILYMFIFPWKLFMWGNLLPFKTIYEIFTGQFITGTFSWVFQDKNKIN